MKNNRKRTVDQTKRVGCLKEERKKENRTEKKRNDMHSKLKSKNHSCTSFFWLVGAEKKKCFCHLKFA